MLKILKVIYSTLAVVMIVNSFIFALPIIGQAQAIEKQAIEQIQLTEAQKAETEKALKEVRIAMYKELNLSSAEIKFVENYADKMETFNQELDKYVTYNKKNGNATLNISAFYKNIKAIQKATGLTQKEVLTLKDIALKMVRNYNKTVIAIKSNSSLAQKNIKTTSVIQDRGYVVEFEITNSYEVRSATASCYQSTWVVITYNYWWGNNKDMRMNKCALDVLIKEGQSMLNFGTTTGAIACGALGLLTVGVAGFGCSVVFIILRYIATNHFNNLSNISRTCTANTRFWTTTYFGRIPTAHSYSCSY